jgi:hypothetical protein
MLKNVEARIDWIAIDLSVSAFVPWSQFSNIHRWWFKANFQGIFQRETILSKLYSSDTLIQSRRWAVKLRDASSPYLWDTLHKFYIFKRIERYTSHILTNKKCFTERSDDTGAGCLHWSIFSGSYLTDKWVICVKQFINIAWTTPLRWLFRKILTLWWENMEKQENRRSYSSAALTKFLCSLNLREWLEGDPRTTRLTGMGL